MKPLIDARALLLDLRQHAQVLEPVAAITRVEKELGERVEAVTADQRRQSAEMAQVSARVRALVQVPATKAATKRAGPAVAEFTYSGNRITSLVITPEADDEPSIEIVPTYNLFGRIGSATITPEF